MTMTDYEKLGVFYLGKHYDPTTQTLKPELLLYDTKDLTTHAVCVGMTGSGKTGLCLALLEEAAIDGIPAIIIDPKGDLGNLLLTFPELKPTDFEPWIEPAEATRNGQTLPEYSASVADRWRKGLADWGQTPERIARFREAVDIAIYTPGSQTGLPITVLRSFAVPNPAVLNNPDAFRERVSTCAAGLLTLLGIEADPLRSREHILLTNLFDRAWRSGRDLDLPALIREVQKPPFDKVGILDLETFFPAQDRFALAMSLNNLLASPGFSAWMEGEPLDVQRLFYTPAGKPRLAILSLSHLSDAERMFFVTLLLTEVLGWMRSQSGTSSLRALLYMDEVFGYFPPTANPPSKTPMLTLLKQARAFGLGIVLATQNPVDLDYKGLSNAGTWFLGRLQTERDKARVLDGLEGAAAATGGQFNRAAVEQILSGLSQRVFLMNNVHESGPQVFQTRWALSYLRGPLTREQISTLMHPVKQASPVPAVTAAPVAHITSAEGLSLGGHPVLPPDVPQLYWPARSVTSAAGKLVYRPALIGAARVHFVQAKSEIDTWDVLQILTRFQGDLEPATVWDSSLVTYDEFDTCATEECATAVYSSLPAGLTRARAFERLTTSLRDFVYRTHRMVLRKCSELKLQSRPGESAGAFKIRLKEAAHERRDLEVEKLRAKYAPKVAMIQERIRKAEQRVETEKSQANQSMLSATLTFGSSVLGALFGRKKISASNASRVASTVRAAGRVASQRGDVGNAKENVAALQQQLAKLEEEATAQVEQLQATADIERMEIEELELKPRKSDISVTRVALVWLPWSVDATGNLIPAFDEPEPHE